MMRGLPIRMRLTLVYGGLLFLALAISGTAVVTLLRYRLTARLDAALELRLEGVEKFVIRETTPDTPDEDIPSELEEYASTQPEGRYIEVVDQQGRVLLDADAVRPPARSREKTFVIYGKSYHTKASASEAPINDSVQEIAILLLGSAPLLLILIGVTGYWISSRSLRPVDEMTQAARTIGASSLSGRLPVPPVRDELSRLAEAWNEMLGRLEESFGRMQRFTADAAHELRTPLAALQTTADLALRRDRSTEEYREALAQVREIAGRINALAEALLVVVRGEGEPAAQPLEQVDAASLVRGLTAEMQPLFNDKDLRLEVALPEHPVYLRADSDGLRRLVAILLDNALKFSFPGGTVTISVDDGPDALTLAVSDTGCGIPEESLTRIFDRFYRVDQSRDRKTGGYGLGLAIAQQIVRAHQGRIEASSVLGQGSVFRVRLPGTFASDTFSANGHG